MEWFIVLVFAITAFIYATIGFGGGSTYTAILAIWGLSHTQIPQISLMCNIIVVSGGCFHFYRAGYLNVGRILPFLITSIPMAYIGGRISISREIFMSLLAASLLIAGMRLLFFNSVRPCRHLELRHVWVWGMLIGGVLGLLSGLVGLGGGIFLAPILYLIRWDTPKGIASASSVFIMMNSLFGLAGQLEKSGLTVDYQQVLPLVLAVFVGGQLGSMYTIRILPALRIQQLTGVLITIVATRLLWKVVVL